MDVTVIGPECFVDAAETVISYKGENYYKRSEKIFDWNDKTAVQTAIGEALGAASVCWETPGGAGVFDSERAVLIANELEEFLQNRWWKGL